MKKFAKIPMHHLLKRGILFVFLLSLIHSAPLRNNNETRQQAASQETSGSRQPSVLDRAEANFRIRYPDEWKKPTALAQHNNLLPSDEYNDESPQITSERSSVLDKAEENFRRLFPDDWKKRVAIPQNENQLPLNPSSGEHFNKNDDRNQNQTRLQSPSSSSSPPVQIPLSHSPLKLKFKRWMSKAKEIGNFITDIFTTPKNNNNSNQRRRRFHSSNSSNNIAAALFVDQEATVVEPIHATVGIAVNDQTNNVPAISVDSSSCCDITGCLGEGFKLIWEGISGLCSSCLCSDSSCLQNIFSTDT